MIRLVIPEMDENEFEAVRQVLASGYLVQGAQVERFESLIGEYLGIEHVVAVSSGTAALHLAVMALGLASEEEVIVADFTFPATANAVVQAGARPVLADIELKTFNMDPIQVEALITERTRVILPVNLFGLAAPMAPILRLAQKHDLFVIEDAACALGARYQGQMCGTLGHMGCFSLHPRKAITTGEGGLIVTRDGQLADRLRSLRNHGIVSSPSGYKFVEAGLNYRMTEFQGALGVAQMGRLETIIEQRRSLAAVYDVLLDDISWLERPTVPSGCCHIYQSYVTLLDESLDRDAIIAALRAKDVETTIGTYACHAQPFYHKAYGYTPGDLPCAYQAFRHSLTLPLHSRMSEENVEVVVQALREVVS